MPCFCLNFQNTEWQRSSNVNKLSRKNTKIQGSNDFRFLLCSTADATGWDGVFEGVFNFATLIRLFYKKTRSVWNSKGSFCRPRTGGSHGNPATAYHWHPSHWHNMCTVERYILTMRYLPVGEGGWGKSTKVDQQASKVKQIQWCKQPWGKCPCKPHGCPLYP